MQVKLKQEPKFRKNQLVLFGGITVCRVIKDPYWVPGMRWIVEIEHPTEIGPIVCIEEMLCAYKAERPTLKVVK